MASINPQDDSFASYLIPIASSRRRADDGEIDIFGAEKYFSGVMDGELERAAAEKIRAKNKPTKETEWSAKSKSGTKSTTSSEASFNSRSNLLRDHRHRRKTPPPPPPPDKPRGRKFLGVFRCSCSGTNAVDVEAECEKVRSAEAKEQIARELRMERLGLGLREEARSFPLNLNPMAGKVTVGREFKNREEKEEEVDDVGSEASSELFELESISTNQGRFTESAPTTEPAPTTSYEPSEASIEWSVVTASAANLSVASQSECHASKPGDAAGRKGGSAHRPRLLMGCASHGAVNVATGARRMPERAASFEVGSVTLPTMLYQMESLKRMEMGMVRPHGAAAGHVTISRVQARPALYLY